MKTRISFVSNSSSSSFCIMGILCEKDTEAELFEGFDESKHSFYDDYFDGSDLEVRDGIEEFYGNYVVGKDVTFMKPDETRQEFRQRVFDALKAKGFTGTLDDVDFRVDGGYEG